jgi:hypothetical protein
MSSEEAVHASLMEVMPTSGKGTLGTWWFLRRARVRLDKTEHISTAARARDEALQPTEAERRMDPRVVAASEEEVVVLWRQRGVDSGGRPIRRAGDEHISGTRGKARPRTNVLLRYSGAGQLFGGSKRPIDCTESNGFETLRSLPLQASRRRSRMAKIRDSMDHASVTLNCNFPKPCCTHVAGAPRSLIVCFGSVEDQPATTRGKRVQEDKAHHSILLILKFLACESQSALASRFHRRFSAVLTLFSSAVHRRNLG